MYHKVNFKLTESQHKKLIHARSNGLGIRLRLSKSMITPSGTTILLTNNEMNKLQDGEHHNITISSSRVQKMGGLLPILPILGGLGAVTGIITSIINSVKGSKTSAAQIAAARATEELARERLKNEKI